MRNLRAVGSPERVLVVPADRPVHRTAADGGLRVVSAAPLGWQPEPIGSRARPDAVRVLR